MTNYRPIFQDDVILSINVKNIIPRVNCVVDIKVSDLDRIFLSVNKYTKEQLVVVYPHIIEYIQNLDREKYTNDYAVGCMFLVLSNFILHNTALDFVNT